MTFMEKEESLSHQPGMVKSVIQSQAQKRSAEVEANAGQGGQKRRSGVINLSGDVGKQAPGGAR